MGQRNTGDEDLTCEEAAEILHVSVVYLGKLIAEQRLVGVRPDRKGEFLIPRASVLAYKKNVKRRQRAGLDQMIAASERSGLYESELEDIPVRRSR
jgi:excisionase family DNA binding protein